MTGVTRMYDILVENECQGAGRARAKAVKKTYQNVFKVIQYLLAFPDLDKKFIGVGDDDPDYNSDYNLCCPSSKGTFLILWLYSIEPPLYFHFNTACRLRDWKYLPLLGPFAQATACILEGAAESYRGDGFKTGNDIKNSPLNTMAGAFIVFRGSQLHPNEVNRYAITKGRRWFD